MKVFRLEDLLTDRERKCEAQLSIIADKIMMDPRRSAGTVFPLEMDFNDCLDGLPLSHGQAHANLKFTSEPQGKFPNYR